jgi:HEAT repeats/Putative zinc-finger
MDSNQNMNNMSCEIIRGELPLYWYGELDATGEAAFDGHLAGCDACTQAWEEWKRTFAALDLDVAEPSQQLLVQCREEFAASIRFEPREPAKSTFAEWWAGLRGGFVMRPIPALAGGLALLAIGFFTARTTSRGAEMAGFEQLGHARVKYASPGIDGRIRLVVEETREREMVGRMEDDDIRGLLMRAAQDSSDPGLRVETVEMLNRGSDTSEVRDALLAVLERDQNAGVRLKAIEGLKAYVMQDDGVRRALSSALLRDTDPGIRMQAIDALMLQRHCTVERVCGGLGSETVGVLQESILREDNDYIRQRTLRALQEVNASAGTF